jgi:hypothetical protein
LFIAVLFLYHFWQTYLTNNSVRKDFEICEATANAKYMVQFIDWENSNKADKNPYKTGILYEINLCMINRGWYFNTGLGLPGSGYFVYWTGNPIERWLNLYIKNPLGY